MRLYGARFSPYYERVHLALTMKGLLDVVECAGMPEDGLKSPRYLRLHPAGKIPCLELDDGRAIPESQVICEFLERTFPANPLVPSEAFARAQMDLVCRFVDTTLFPSLRPLMVSSPDAAMASEAQEALRILERLLVSAPYAAGEVVSLADCALLPALVYVERLGSRADVDLWESAPRLSHYRCTIGEKPVAVESRQVMTSFLAA